MNALWLSVALAALPPQLSHLLQAARHNNHTLGISRAQLAEQQATVQQALAAMTPTLQLSGGYTRNQYEAVVSFPNSILGISPPSGFTSVQLQPYNTWSGTVGINLPLFSAVNLYRYDEARHGRDSSDDSVKATDAQVLLSTAQGYYQTLGAQGVEDAAERALKTAQESLRVTETRFSAGTANKLSVDRAKVDVATAQQTVATTKQALAIAIRNLETLSGEKLADPLPAAEPEPLAGATGQAEADFVQEAEATRPELAQITAALTQQESTLKEAWGQLAPSLVANAQEHFTNATGFANQPDYWTAGVNLAWTLDPVGTPAALQKAHAAIEEQRQRLAQELDTVRDEVHTAWLAVEADRAKLGEATSAAASAREALTITQEQNRAGTATSLDVSQAQRDAFNADATLAQTQADLAAALLALKKAAGESLLAEAAPDTTAPPGGTP